MVFLNVVKTHWMGTTGGPGLTQLAYETSSGGYGTNGDAQAAVNAVRKFWAAVATYIPNEITLTVDPVVDTYAVDSVNNDLESTATAATAPAVVAGIGAGTYSMAAGLKLNLNTTGIRYGRRVRGCLYIVPCDSSAFTNTGVVNPSAKTAIDAAAQTMITDFITGGITLGVWSRWNKIKHPERPSAFTPVATAKTNDKTAVLRGRRD